MKKRFCTVILVFALVAMLGLSACMGGGPTATPDPADKSAERTQLILGLDASFPPMGYEEEGKIVGFDIDVARAVCDHLGWELITQPIDWDANEMELNAGTIDCIWNGMSITEARQATMSMTPAYMNNEQVIVVMANSGYQSLDDLAGKKLALQSGSSAEDALNENAAFKDALSKVNTFGDNMYVLMDIEQGGSDAALLDSVVAEWYIEQNGADNYRVLDQALASEEYGIGFRKADVALTNAVFEALKALKADGTLGDISTEWFGSDVTTVQN